MINASSYLVTFISTHILDLLFPLKAKLGQPAAAIGSDIFKFLANHSQNSIGSDFKNAVKASLQMGRPISLELRLCARPYMGFERFLLHWTPLKDEGGRTAWIVLTFGNERRA